MARTGRGRVRVPKVEPPFSIKCVEPCITVSKPPYLATICFTTLVAYPVIRSPLTSQPSQFREETCSWESLPTLCKTKQSSLSISADLIRRHRSRVAQATRTGLLFPRYRPLVVNQKATTMRKEEQLLRKVCITLSIALSGRLHKKLKRHT